ncbi:hypothetical protein ACFLVM_02195 [Chloroflexota bacterium]
MHISRLRIVFIGSIIILGVLLTLTVFGPLSSNEELSAVTGESIIARDNKWIIQFEIINREGSDKQYTIIWSSGEWSYSQKVTVKDGRKYSAIRHFYRDDVNIKDGEIHLTVRKEGESTPIEESTYYMYSYEEE